MTRTSPTPAADDLIVTKLSYTAPRELAARYDLSGDLATKLVGIDGITDAVVDG